MRFSEFNTKLVESRIQHAEDLIFWEGSKGARRALEALKDLERDGHKQTTLKWDGSPAVVFGRNTQDQFVFTDKHGWSAKTYDGKTASGQDLYNMLMTRGHGEKGSEFESFARRMGRAFEVIEQAMPNGFYGYFKGDLLYFETPPIEENCYVFKPNVVSYRVPVNSKLGDRISRSKVGIVIHRYENETGHDRPIKNVEIFDGDELLIFPSITVQEPAVLQDELVKKTEALISEYERDIDDFLNESKLRTLQLTDLPKVFYAYINAKVDLDLNNLGNDFLVWLKTSKVSQAKQQKIAEYLNQHQKAFRAIWSIITNLMHIKDDIIKQFDSGSNTISSSINGQHGGEGYVLSHPRGDIKLVGRSHFTRANRAVARN